MFAAMFPALERAVQIVGSQSELARRLGVKQQHVHQWIERGWMPAEYCRPTEDATGGQVTRYELDEKVFGPAPDGGAGAAIANESPAN